MKKRIVIVDDHILVAEALTKIIAGFNDFEVIYYCENGIDLTEKIQDNPKPDIILLDVSMPKMNGFETAIWLKQNFPDILIMVLSMQNDDMSLIKMIKNGANGYMLKNSYPAELEYALQKMISKGRYFPEWASEKVFANLATSTGTEQKIKLSEREMEFLKYTTQEMNYKEIAECMFCSARTIENYRDSLFEKLEIRTRIGLAVYALKNGYSQ